MVLTLYPSFNRKTLDLTRIIKTICESYSMLSDDCIADLKSCLVLTSFEKNHLLVKEGQYASKVYYLIEGSARAFYLKDGKDITDWFAFENDFISSINSFFLDVASPHYIELLEPTVLLEFSKDEFLRLCDKHHDFERLGRVIVTKTMLLLQQRIVGIQFETAQQKYENILKIYPNIEQRVPLTHIASYLGITLETLSRVRGSSKRI